MEGGEYQQSAKQVTCITESVGPNNNGRSNESWGELSVTAGDPLVEGSSNIESSSKIISSQRCDEVEKGEPCERGKDPQSLVRLRTGSNKVQSIHGMLNGEYLERETTLTDLQSEVCVEEDIGAVETCSYGNQDMVMEGQTTGGESRQDPVPYTVLPSKVFLSSFIDEDLAIKQKGDPDISFVYQSLLKGCKRPLRKLKGNDQAEKFNRTLEHMIKAYLKGEQEDWYLNLGCLAATFRASTSLLYGFTPIMLMLGREVRIPAEIRSGRI